MATDQCDNKVFERGQVILMIDAPKAEIENLCRAVTKATKCKVDWSYMGGRAIVRHLGDRAAVKAELQRHLFGHTNWCWIWNDLEQEARQSMKQEMLQMVLRYYTTDDELVKFLKILS